MSAYLTIDSVMALGPCSRYTRESLTEYAAGRKRVRLTTALRDESLPVEDRGWLATAVLPELRFWSADRAVRLHVPAALDAAGLHGHAATLRALPDVADEQTAADAHAAAYVAARTIADPAARAAAYAAARAADHAADANVYGAVHAAACAAYCIDEWQALVDEAIRRAA